MSYYDETEPTMQVSILGTPYKIWMDVSKRDDPELALCDGYCDYSVKRIVVCDNEDSDLCDYDEHKKNSLRHELVHAYLFCRLCLLLCQLLLYSYPSLAFLS